MLLQHRWQESLAAAAAAAASISFHFTQQGWSRGVEAPPSVLSHSQFRVTEPRTSGGRPREEGGEEEFIHQKHTGGGRWGGEGNICSTERWGVKWGGTSAIEGTGIVSFPWSTTPSPSAPPSPQNLPPSPPSCPARKAGVRLSFRARGPLK